MSPRCIALSISALALASGCGPDETKSPPPVTYKLDREALLDPESCAKCHPDHVREWSGSMHAYAADDPLFIAMNERGQRETGGALGSFCVNCHAPVAVLEGATKDGLNIAELPKPLRGVTCYFCHSIDSITGDHNASLTLADDLVMRGGLSNPTPNEAHASAYSPLLDRESLDSASLCGSCHDIVTPKGVHLERTFQEWKETVFSKPPVELTCSQCHMEGRDGVAADAPGVPLRRVHDHSFPGVDVALTPFPEADAQREAVQRSLDTTLQAVLCVNGEGMADARVEVVVDNVAAGHSWPSGASQDRRAWAEVIAYAGGAPIYQSGVVPDGGDVTALMDPDLWLIRDCIFDEKGARVHMFWDAADVSSNLLPGPVTNNPMDPAYYLSHVTRAFPRAAGANIGGAPDRVTFRVRLQPVGRDVMDALVASGDLDPSLIAAMPTFTLAGATLEWTSAKATIKYPDQGRTVSCVTAGLSTTPNNATPAPEHANCSP